MINFDLVQKKFCFKLRDHASNKKIQYLDFDDGRRYKIQHPSMIQVHYLLHDSDQPETDIFLKGMENLYHENEQSPEINEKYFEEFPMKMGEWSLIIRGLLSQRWQEVQQENIPDELPPTD